jgi:hypothetical protein
MSKPKDLIVNPASGAPVNPASGVPDDAKRHESRNRLHLDGSDRLYATCAPRRNAGSRGAGMGAAPRQEDGCGCATASLRLSPVREPGIPSRTGVFVSRVEADKAALDFEIANFEHVTPAACVRDARAPIGAAFARSVTGTFDHHGVPLLDHVQVGKIVFEFL